MDEKNDINCFLRREPICPHCGYQMEDSGEISKNEDSEVECWECEKPFVVTREIRFTTRISPSNSNS